MRRFEASNLKCPIFARFGYQSRDRDIVDVNDRYLRERTTRENK